MTAHLKLRIPTLSKRLAIIDKHRTRQSVPLTDIQTIADAPYAFACPGDEGDWQPIDLGGEWGGRKQYAYFRAKLTVPDDWTDQHLELRIDAERRFLQSVSNDGFPAGPEGLVFIDGRPVGGLDRAHNSIAHPFKPGREYDVRWIWFAGRIDNRHRLATCHLAAVDKPTERLYHHVRVARDVVNASAEESVGRERMMRAIEAAIAALDFREHHANNVPNEVKRDPKRELFYASVPAAVEAFEKTLAELPADPAAPLVTSTGHAHIDLAWLWTTDITRQKNARTFATQLRNLERYDKWVFNQSSPQAYAWLEQDSPELFKAVRKQIDAGRWEAEGATWVEMDTNVPSGESLVRQLLHGKAYFQEKFGIDSKMLWLPDVFGYSASLPQLLRLAGVETFVTSKLSWSQYNRFPHDTFCWRGIDGSNVATTFISTPQSDVSSSDTGWGATYNGSITVNEIGHTWREYRQKNHLIEPLHTYGVGDGGGGPTEQMHETAERLATWPLPAGMARPNRRAAGKLAAEVAERIDELPVWDGELYLEYHRGTLTSQAWLKRANRKLEIALHNLEWLGVMAAEVGHTLDREQIEAVWKDLMLLQFHDILPGSSVHDVYVDARPMVSDAEAKLDEMTAAAIDALVEQIDTTGFDQPVVLFNTLSWPRHDPVKLPGGDWVDGIDVPAGGWTVIDAGKARVNDEPVVLSVSEDGRKLNNQWWQLTLDDQGRIVELIDREENRSVFADGEVANELQVFHDRSMAYEQWDIDLTFESEPLPSPTCESIEVVESNDVRVAVEVVWHMPPIGDDPARHSSIRQRIVMYARDPRIDFETTADWHEHHQLLKVAFPVDVRAAEAAYEIQFGHIRRPTHRNTSWDLAKFECCAHRFVDLAEHGYGVALMNDCKYGHDIHNGVIRLTAIKATQQPDAVADQGEHMFTYSLLPHAGTFQDAGVIRAAAELNNPVIARAVEPSEGDRPRESTWLRAEPAAVVADTVKPAEDGDGVIVRIYESHGSHATAELTFASPPKKVAVVNLLEQTLESDDRATIDEESGVVRLPIKPFEVVTLRVR